jgi:hypothetical protein
MLSASLRGYHLPYQTCIRKELAMSGTPEKYPFCLPQSILFLERTGAAYSINSIFDTTTVAAT